MHAFRTNLDLGGCVIRGLSVKVTEEVTGKFCISSGFTQGFILPITHSILHVVSIKLRIGKRMKGKHNVQTSIMHLDTLSSNINEKLSFLISGQWDDKSLYLISTAWITVWGTPCTLPKMTLQTCMWRWVGTAEHSPLLPSAGWLEFCSDAERHKSKNIVYSFIKAVVLKQEPEPTREPQQTSGGGGELFRFSYISNL